MKKHLLTSALSLVMMAAFVNVAAQEPVPGQNPNYRVSRDKYMAMSDSINQWHGTTVQQTYKAYDWYEAKQERRQQRVQFRRDLRMERARNSYRHYPYHPYGNYYGNHYYQPYRWHRAWWWF